LLNEEFSLENGSHARCLVTVITVFHPINK